MNREEIESIVQKYISEGLNCKEDDLKKEGVIFAANDNRKYPFLKFCTIGYGTIVSASGVFLPKLKRLFDNKTKDEIFECPFVYGQSIYYIPGGGPRGAKTLSSKFEYTLLQGEDVQRLRGIRGFENSLAFDEKGNTPTCIVLYAAKDNEIIALAGASEETEKMWELGVDVRPEYRKEGLATALVSNLIDVILEQGIVPFYCASVTNIASQAVAHKCGLIPYWVSTYRNILDGSSVYDTILEELIRKWEDEADCEDK